MWKKEKWKWKRWLIRHLKISRIFILVFILFWCLESQCSFIFFSTFYCEHFQNADKIKELYSGDPYTHHLDTTISIYLICFSIKQSIYPSFYLAINPFYFWTYFNVSCGHQEIPPQNTSASMPPIRVQFLFAN